jgi:hypothetical protein
LKERDSMLVLREILDETCVLWHELRGLLVK